MKLTNTPTEKRQWTIINSKNVIQPVIQVKIILRKRPYILNTFTDPYIVYIRSCTQEGQPLHYSTIDSILYSRQYLEYRVYLITISLLITYYITILRLEVWNRMSRKPGLFPRKAFKNGWEWMKVNQPEKYLAKIKESRKNFKESYPELYKKQIKQMYLKRKKNREFRNKERKKYYQSSQLHATQRWSKWSTRELDLVITFTGTDRELGKLIARSIAAIQQQRGKLKKGKIK